MPCPLTAGLAVSLRLMGVSDVMPAEAWHWLFGWAHPPTFLLSPKKNIPA